MASISNTRPPARLRHSARRTVHRWSSPAGAVPRTANPRKQWSPTSAAAPCASATTSRGRDTIHSVRRRKGDAASFVRAHVVAVRSRRRTESRVELVSHRMRICHPEIVREERVQRASHRRRCPLRRHAHSDRLAPCMDAGVGAAGSECRHRLRAELAERRLEHPLYGATIGLSLPSAEVRAVIVQHEQQHAGRHRSESYPVREVCQANHDVARTRAPACEPHARD